MINRALLVAILTIMLLPLWFMLIGSFQDIHGVFLMPPQFFPRNATLANYEWVFAQPLLGWFRNTVIVVAFTTVISVIISTTAGYAFAFYPIPGKAILWALLLSAIMIPRMSMIIPRFVVIRKMGLSGTLAAAILPNAYIPITMYLAREYFQTVPRSLLESARIDGASELQILTHIVAPVSRPIVTAAALFAAIDSLNDYLWQLLQLQRANVQTLLIGLMREVMRRGGDATNVNPVGRSLAVAVILLAPLLLIFLVANKYFTSALGGAVRE